MSKEKFLKSDQVKILEDLKWDVKESGAFFHFKRDDFKKEYMWNQLCQTAGQSPDSEFVFILFVASKNN